MRWYVFFGVAITVFVVLAVSIPLLRSMNEYLQDLTDENGTEDD